jgi:hypothetical protein
VFADFPKRAAGPGFSSYEHPGARGDGDST